MREDVSFDSGGVRCAAWHYRGEGARAPRPCVVMAHGFGGTRDSGLEPYAERFAAAGLDVLLFDYRGFGASEGEPRQLVDWRRHREDYRAALAFARTLEGVDPGRVALWGSSYSGGHVIPVAAADGRVAAVVSQVPATDGLAALRALVRSAGVGALARATLLGLRDQGRALAGREPLHMPLVGPPGSLAAMTTPDAEPGYRAIAGPSWRNEFCARGVLDVALNRPVRHARRLPCPVLFQIADEDAIAPPSAVLAAARKAGGRAEVRRYPVGHFGVYVGEPFERVVADQLAFLTRHLAPAQDAAASAA